MLRRPSALRSRRRLGVAVAIAGLPALAGCVGVPKLDEAISRARTVAQTTKIFAADGSLIAELHAEENREVIALDQVPRHVRDAVLAIEDARFYEHSGVDYLAIARALTRNVAEGRVAEGGSTITQQLVKNTIIGNEKTVERKIREAILAFQIEQRFSKDEILERYLNTVYFGRGAYGIEAAAETFFRKHARRLSLVEGAFLAGMIRSPTRYDPAKDRKGAVARRNRVLRRMHDEEMLTDERLARAVKEPLRLRPKQELDRYPYAYFVEYVKERIFDGQKEFRALGGTRADRINAVFKGGLRIHTSLQPRLQRIAERATKAVLPRKADPRTAFVALDPRDGGIVAMVGGRDFWNPKDRFAKLNLTVRRRQPGSAFKPFTLVAALESGIPLTKTYRGGSRITLRLPEGGTWSPENYEGSSAGGRVTLLRATARSVNVVYAQVALEVGVRKIMDVARRMGIASKLPPYISLTLGTGEVTPLEMANAMATLANGGFRERPTPVQKVTDAAGKVLYEAKPLHARALELPVVALATKAMQEVIKAGTGTRARLDRPVAGKTGTSEKHGNAWFVGFVPQLAAATWVGFPEGNVPLRPPRTRIKVTGGSYPAMIWARFMREALEGVPVQTFSEASELLVRVEVDKSRNCLPNDFTPPYLIEERAYIRGTEPTTVCAEPTSGEIPSTPSVVGLAASAARSMLERAGFAVSSATRSCPAYARGTVCDQSPDPGEEAEVGDRATISVSSGQSGGPVPAVLGRTLAGARARIEDAGYAVKVVEQANPGTGSGCGRDPTETRDGYVWLQATCPGDVLARGATVTIYVNP